MSTMTDAPKVDEENLRARVRSLLEEVHPEPAIAFGKMHHRESVSILRAAEGSGRGGVGVG